VVGQQPPPGVVRGQGLTGRAMLVAAAAVVAICASIPTRTPWLVWNASASVPIGLYWIDAPLPVQGDLALVRLPPQMERLADQRGYLPASAHLLKPVAATAGDRVCRIGRTILVRGVVAALAEPKDSLGRTLPNWQGCRVVKAGQLFVLGPTRDSFDSRYFGPVSADRVVGRAHAIWTFK
jgi:conjugative transfer signal peptidase TraF